VDTRSFTIFYEKGDCGLKPYNVYFAYYSEENGQFEGTKYEVEAESQFDARQKAWGLIDSDKEMRNASCVSQCGVTWDASALDLQDYFNMLAANDKCTINQIENIDIPDYRIHHDENRVAGAKAVIRECWGSLGAIRSIAKEMGQPHGMVPPTIFEELHYSKLLAGELEQKGHVNEARSLYNIISDAEKWDESGIASIDNLFHDGNIWLNGHAEYLYDHFGRGGVFPEKADPFDMMANYIDRWDRVRAINKLSQLPVFDEKDVIRGSGDIDSGMSFESRVLVLRVDKLPKNQQKPENILWIRDTDRDYARGIGDNSRNVITGRSAYIPRQDFAGILRPEIEHKIDFEALGNEYAKTSINAYENMSDNHRMDEAEDDQEDEYF